MSDEDVLKYIKATLGITGDYQDDALKVYIGEIKDYMSASGVIDDVINSKLSLGAIARGVADIWNLGSGQGQLSPYFYERVIQLTFKGSESDV